MEEQYLDYNRWWACFQCGRDVVPYEDEPIPDERICPTCQDEIGFEEEDEMILIYGG